MRIADIHLYMEIQDLSQFPPELFYCVQRITLLKYRSVTRLSMVVLAVKSRLTSHYWSPVVHDRGENLLSPHEIDSNVIHSDYAIPQAYLLIRFHTIFTSKLAPMTWAIHLRPPPGRPPKLVHIWCKF